MNSTVRLIFNESFIEKKGLLVPWIVHGTHWQTTSHVKTLFSIKKEKSKKEGKHKCTNAAQKRNPNAYLVWSLFWRFSHIFFTWFSAMQLLHLILSPFPCLLNIFGIYYRVPLKYILVNYFRKFFMEKWKNNLLFWQFFQLFIKTFSKWMINMCLKSTR